MASNREERKQMRLRGAGTRQATTVDFGFSFGSPTFEPQPSLSPAPAQRDPSPEKAVPPRQTPGRGRTPVSSTSQKTPGSSRNGQPERPSTFDIPDDSSVDGRGSAKRRRIDSGPTISTKPTITENATLEAEDIHIDVNDSTRVPALTEDAQAHEQHQVEGLNLLENATAPELDNADGEPRNEEQVEQQEESSHESNKENEATNLNPGQMEPAEVEQSPAAKRRKKRKSIGQQRTKRRSFEEVLQAEQEPEPEAETGEGPGSNLKSGNIEEEIENQRNDNPVLAELRPGKRRGRKKREPSLQEAATRGPVPPVRGSREGTMGETQEDENAEPKDAGRRDRAGALEPSAAKGSRRGRKPKGQSVLTTVVDEASESGQGEHDGADDTERPVPSEQGPRKGGRPKSIGQRRKRQGLPIPLEDPPEEPPAEPREDAGKGKEGEAEEEEEYVEPEPSRAKPGKKRKSTQSARNSQQSEGKRQSSEMEAADVGEGPSTRRNDEPAAQPGPKGRRGRRPRQQSSNGDGDEGGEKSRKETVPITVHRFANAAALDIALDSGEASGSESPDELSSRRTLASRSGVNTADVLSQICRETLDKTLATLGESISTEQNQAKRAEWKRKRKAVEAFGTELDGRLFELSTVLDSNFALTMQLKKAKRDTIALRGRLMAVKQEREELALRMDDVRRRHVEEEEVKAERDALNSSLHDLDLAIDRSQSHGETSDPDPSVGLEFLLRTVAEDVSSLAPAGRGGILNQVKAFNAQLERTALMLERPL